MFLRTALMFVVCVNLAWMCAGQASAAGSELCNDDFAFECPEDNFCIFPDWVCDDQAHCQDGYDEVICDGNLCDVNPCLNNVACIVYENRTLCLCPSPYHGDLCEKDACEGNNCSGRGMCEPYYTYAFCTCDAGWSGDRCEIDNVPPSFIPLSDFMVPTDEGQSTATVILPLPSDVNDNSGGLVTIATSPANSSVLGIGPHVITYTLTDIDGNDATFTITVTVEDAEDPMITCPADITQDSDVGVNHATVTLPDPSSPTVSDNSERDLTVTTTMMGTVMFDIGTHTVTYTVTDPSERTASCDLTIIVTDAVDLMITCPADITQDSDVGVNHATVLLPDPSSLTFSDNSEGDLTVTSPMMGTVTLNIGTHTVTYTVTDPGSRTASCNLTITVTDLCDNPETVECPSDSRCIYLEWICDGVDDCTDGYDEAICEGNRCNVNPCQNNGTCIVYVNRTLCLCPSRYLGDLCQEVLPCSIIPCYNDGTCVASSDGATTFCVCPAGFTGEFCEQVTVNPCNSSPCGNNGACNIDANNPNDFTCSCFDDWTGPTCQVTEGGSGGLSVGVVIGAVGGVVGVLIIIALVVAICCCLARNKTGADQETILTEPRDSSRIHPPRQKNQGLPPPPYKDVIPSPSSAQTSVTPSDYLIPMQAGEEYVYAELDAPKSQKTEEDSPPRRSADQETTLTEPQDASDYEDTISPPPGAQTSVTPSDYLIPMQLLSEKEPKETAEGEYVYVKNVFEELGAESQTANEVSPPRRSADQETTLTEPQDASDYEDTISPPPGTQTSVTP